MVIKWIKAIVTKPITILTSIYYRIFGKNEDIATKRINICNKCDNKQNIKLVGDICGVCGCILDNKTRIKDEHCDLCKW